MNRRDLSLLLVPVLFTGVAWSCGSAPDAPAEGMVESHLAAIESWRADREQRLRSEDGWLSLIGLHWLEHGETRFGSEPSNPIVLPADAAPPVAGSFHYDGEVVRVVAPLEVGLLLNDELVTEAVLNDDAAENLDPLRLGRLTMFVIRREDRHAIRVKDPESATQKEFRGLEYFPIDAGYKMTGQLRPYEQTREMAVPTVLGTPATMLSKGRVEFSLGGETRSLEALVSESSPGELFLIFRDETTGKETYGAGRYLYAAFQGDEVDLDFNRAYNPPCAFTPYATCPLPPRGNNLQVRVEAGEKSYGHH